MTPRDEARARLEAALGAPFDDRAHLDAALIHRSYCAEHPERVLERAARVPRRRGARAERHRPRRSATYPDLSEGELSKRARVGRERRGARRRRRRDRARRRAAARQGRGGVGRAREAVDPRRRDGGGDRRGVPRRRVGRRRRARAAAARRPDPLPAPTIPTAATTRRGCRRSRRSSSTSCPATSVRAEGPDHSKRFFATSRCAARSYGEGEGRSKKQAEQAAARAAWQRVPGRLHRAPPSAHGGALSEEQDA